MGACICGTAGFCVVDIYIYKTFKVKLIYNVQYNIIEGNKEIYKGF